MNAHETLVINAYRDLFARLSAICLNKQLNNHQAAMEMARELDFFKEPARTDGLDSLPSETANPQPTSPLDE